MGDQYTYLFPDSSSFISTLVKYLMSKGNKEIAEKLRGCDCSFTDTGSFTHSRWNEHYAILYLEVPMEKLDYFDETIQKTVCEAANRIMPRSAGYLIGFIEIQLKIVTTDEIESSGLDIEDIMSSMSDKLINLLPDDIIEKGKEMAEAYLYMYYVENSLRQYIEYKGTGVYGPDYFSKFSIPREVSTSITKRKESERKNSWLSVCRGSILYYLDFIELSKIIEQNWEIFKDDLPSLEWIRTKISEMAQCRHLIAHNSYIADHEKDVIRTNYESIMRQLGYINDK